MELKPIINKIKPNKKEKEEMITFTNKLLKVSKKITKNVKPVLCGSIKKDTWLSKRYEIDLFLLFDPKIPKKELEKRGLRIAKKIIKNLNGKYEIAFAEHPYLRGWVGKYQIDLVPCYDIKNPEKIKSSVDRTPHHVKFIKRNLKNPDQVRLLKQFCIANECYGADVKTLGFSGYLCELLIIKYKNFKNLAKKASRWRAGKIITFNKINLKLIRKKFKSPLIVIDPVDKNRNVGAAISVEKFYKFVKSCKEFIKNPKKELFFKRKLEPYSVNKILKEFKRRGTQWYFISFEKPKVIEDVLYPQMNRFSRSIERMLSERDFKVLRKGFYCNDKCILVLEMKIWEIPKISKNIGPNVYSKHSEEFLKHYKEKNVFIEGENWVVEIENKFTEALQFLKSFFEKPKKELLERGIPSKIAPKIKNCKIDGGKNILNFISKTPKEFRVFLRKWFEKDLNVV